MKPNSSPNKRDTCVKVVCVCVCTFKHVYKIYKIKCVYIILHASLHKCVYVYTCALGEYPPPHTHTHVSLTNYI